MGHNVELKARASEAGGAGDGTAARWHRIAAELAGAPHTVERQIDTYYPCPKGRLKLRRRWVRPPGGAERAIEPELIAYDRPDSGDPTPSHYRLI
ncbi:MAG: CYTH domain-containing protein, partial [Gemmatimonadetes bacterium]|nr:CYTH domain-containing protein [Gemmatimonadota bacterium]